MTRLFLGCCLQVSGNYSNLRKSCLWDENQTTFFVRREIGQGLYLNSSYIFDRVLTPTPAWRPRSQPLQVRARSGLGWGRKPICKLFLACVFLFLASFFDVKPNYLYFMYRIPLFFSLDISIFSKICWSFLDFPLMAIFASFFLLFPISPFPFSFLHPPYTFFRAGGWNPKPYLHAWQDRLYRVHLQRRNVEIQEHISR